MDLYKEAVMEQSRVKQNENKGKKDLRSLDIPWWIGGPKMINCPSRKKEIR